MVRIDPKVLADAVSQFLVKAQKQADHDPDAISRLEQENETLREALATLQDRIEHGLATLGRDGENLQERVAAAEEDIVEIGEQFWKLHDNINSLEASKEGNGSLAMDVLDELYHGQRILTPIPDAGPKETRRRDAAPQNPRRKAFHAHYWAMRQKYHVQKPGRDHRAFIWSFVEGISDKECARYIQEYLIDELPGKAWRSKSPRNGRIMALGKEMKWDDVKEAMSHLPEPPFWA